MTRKTVRILCDGGRGRKEFEPGGCLSRPTSPPAAERLCTRQGPNSGDADTKSTWRCRHLFELTLPFSAYLTFIRYT